MWSCVEYLQYKIKLLYTKLLYNITFNYLQHYFYKLNLYFKMIRILIHQLKLYFSKSGNTSSDNNNIKKNKKGVMLSNVCT